MGGFLSYDSLLVAGCKPLWPGWILGQIVRFREIGARTILRGFKGVLLGRVGNCLDKMGKWVPVGFK